MELWSYLNDEMEAEEDIRKIVKQGILQITRRMNFERTQQLMECIGGAFNVSRIRIS